MRLLRAITATALCATTIAIACDGGGDGPAPPPTSTPAPGTIELRYDGGVLHVELAITPQERAIGLSNRDSLAHDAGMLFIFENVRVPRFWMKDTRIPLDMIWIAADKRIVEIDANVQPQPGVPDSELTFYSPEVAVAYGLELNAGAAARLGLAPGSQLAFDAPLQ